MYELVLKNGNVRYRNEKRFGSDFMLQISYLLIDTISLVVIIGILMSSRAKGGGGGMGQLPFNKTKKF